MKKPKLSTMKKKAWKIFSQYIKLRDDYTCFTCGRKSTGSGLHAGHFLAKRCHGALLYFDPSNVHAQCYHCNINLGGNGPFYSLNLREKYGTGYDEVLISRIPDSLSFKPTVEWYKGLIEKYDYMTALQPKLPKKKPNSATD